MVAEIVDYRSEGDEAEKSDVNPGEGGMFAPAHGSLGCYAHGCEA